MFRVIDEASRARILDEALEGKRGLGEVATAHGVSSTALREWLEEHYGNHPEDPRRHLIQRESDKYTRESDAPVEAAIEPIEPDAPDDENQAREDMGKKQKVQRNGKARHPKYAEAMALIEAGKLSQAEISRQLGVTEGTVSFWAKKARLAPIEAAKTNKIRAAVIADFKAGYVGDTLAKRHKKVVGRTAIYRWIAEYRQEQEQKAEQKKENLQKARDAKNERLKDPAYREEMRQRHWRNRAEASAPNGQQALQLGDSTRLSRPEPEPRSVESQIAAQMVVRREPSSTVTVVRHQAEFPPDSQMLTDTLREAIDERNTLRGMVTLLQREQDSLKKQLDLYRRTFGEISQR